MQQAPHRPNEANMFKADAQGDLQLQQVWPLPERLLELVPD